MPIRRREIASGLPGGMEPVSKRGQSSPAAGPSPARARRALGRMLVTPTFVVGIAIVLAAILAYSTTQTHLLFSGLGPACEAVSCSTTSAPGPNGGVPLRTSASPEPGISHPAKPGSAARQIVGVVTRRVPGGARPASGPRTPAARGSGQDPKTGSVPAPTAPGRGHSAVPRVTLGYQTLFRWQGGFVGTITITSHGSSGIPNWLLWMRYPGSRVDHVRGVRWYPSGRHAGVAAPWQYEQVLQSGTSVQFTFRVRGRRPGPPPGCFFDASRCGFGRSGR